MEKVGDGLRAKVPVRITARWSELAVDTEIESSNLPARRSANEMKN